MDKEKDVPMKAGLEIHQQLDTGKLFCRCPSVLRKDKADWIVNRRLHAVAGESGEVDVAAIHEALKAKEFVYEGYKDTCCLVEYDEQPPLEIDKEALDIAIQIALLLNCEILPVSQIMRKTVLDGSNTSGFQRTVLIARNGWIETSKGKVGIDGVNLEEDAARIIERGEEKSVFRLDRLGIPLVEIGTAPDLKDAEQIKEAALKLGEILRSAKVKRGLGTIRQDLNISVAGHPRVEIKGFQDPKMMIKTVEIEVERQTKIGKKGESEVRRAKGDGTTEFLRPMPGSSRMYPETDLSLLRLGRKIVDNAKKNLPKLKGEQEKELRGKGLTEEMISQLLRSRRLKDFELLIKIYNEPNFVAKSMLLFPKEIASKKGVDVEDVFGLDVIENILSNVAVGKIQEGDVKKVMEKIGEGESIEKALKVEKTDLRHLEAKVVEILKAKPGLSIGAYMGLVMKELQGKVEGKEVMEILRKLVK